MSLNSRLHDRDSIETSWLYFTSWKISDPPSEEDWPWRQEDVVGHTVLWDTKGSWWNSCFHVAHSLVKSPVKKIKALRVGHSFFWWASHEWAKSWWQEALESEDEWEYSSLTVLVELWPHHWMAELGNKLVSFTWFRGIISSLTLQPYGWWAYQVLLSSPSWHCQGVLSDLPLLSRIPSDGFSMPILFYKWLGQWGFHTRQWGFQAESQGTRTEWSHTPSLIWCPTGTWISAAERRAEPSNLGTNAYCKYI